MSRVSTDPARARRRRRRRFALAVVALAIALPVAGGYLTARPNLGARATGARLERAHQSPQYDVERGAFVNTLPTIDPELGPVLRAWWEGAPGTSPESPPPLQRHVAEALAEPPAGGLRVTWLGHSTLIVELEGARVLVDPVWGERCSPWSFMGPSRFHAPPLPLDQLPPLDAVVISHDHYDHLDAFSIRALAERVPTFIVPLGVGAHLEAWGVATAAIVELDWWESHELHGVRLVATPARHFSGRWLDDRNATLWAGWAFIGAERRAYYSGDTAMFPGFREIGRRLGPFDITMIESGQYNQLWADVHLGPEQAVQAHQDVGGRLMLPVHWGTFELALHSWTEPVERVLAAAEAAGVTVATPMLGQSVEPPRSPTERWWPPETPWQTAAEAPVRSSGLD